MKTLFALMSFLLLLAKGCTTTGTKKDHERWKLEQAMIRSGFDTKFRDLRKRVKTTRIKSPYFWKVEKNGKSSWILGSIKEGVDTGALPLAVTSELSLAKTVIMKLDEQQLHEHLKQLSSNNDFEWMAQLAPMLPSDPTLDKLIGDEAWDVYRKDMQPVPAETLKKLTPTVAKSLYIVWRANLLGEALDCMDCSLKKDAIAAKKPLIFLETPQDAIASLQSDSLKDDVSAEELRKFITNKPLQSVEEHIEQTYQLALQYKLGTIENSQTKSKNDSDYDKFLLQQRETWQAKLEPHLSAGQAFVAFDVEHLIGPSGLLKALEKSGFSVTRWGASTKSDIQKPVQ